jgi:hypothetical protein
MVEECSKMHLRHVRTLKKVRVIFYIIDIDVHNNNESLVQSLGACECNVVSSIRDVLAVASHVM